MQRFIARTGWRIAVGLALGVGTAVLAPTHASAQAQAPEAATVADVGRDYYLRYCSTCHGESGKGDGPTAQILTKQPADLTTIAARSGGEFPALRVAEVIDGRREVIGHGTREMPIWGERFGELVVRGAPGEQSAIRGQVLLLVEYLRSIQKP